MRASAWCLAALLALAATAAPAQWRPEEPIRIVVPFTSGGGTELQAFHEAGLNFGIDGWIAFFGPGGMKPEIVTALYREIARIVGTAEYRKFVFDSGLDYGGMPPGEFAAKVKSDYERWGRVIRDAGVKLD